MSDELTPVAVIDQLAEQQRAQTHAALRNQAMSEQQYAEAGQRSEAQQSAMFHQYAELARNFLSRPEKRDLMLDREAATPVGTMFRNLILIEGEHNRHMLEGDSLVRAIRRVVDNCVQGLEAAKAEQPRGVTQSISNSGDQLPN